MTNEPLNIGVITIFPEMFESILKSGIVAKAINNNLVSITFSNPRDFAEDNRKTIDEKVFGGGPGMLMMAPPNTTTACILLHLAAPCRTHAALACAQLPLPAPCHARLHPTGLSRFFLMQDRAQPAAPGHPAGRSCFLLIQRLAASCCTWRHPAAPMLHLPAPSCPCPRLATPGCIPPV